jgi:HK97 family phage major capsid protein
MDQATVSKVKDELTAVRGEAAVAWKAFDEYREHTAKENIDVTKDKTAFEKGEELHRAYAEKAQRAAELETMLVKSIEMLGADAPRPLEGIKGGGDELEGSRGERKRLPSMGEKFMDRGKVEVSPVKVLDREHAKALITGLSDTSAGAFVTADRQGFYGLLLQTPVVLDLITTGETDSDTVEYVKQTSFTNAAAETAEATSLSDGSKPESAMAFAVVQALVRTIAHWIPVTKRALNDAAGLRTLIDSQMREGVRQRLEAQVINGNGTGENLRGILNTTGIGTVAVGASPDQRLDAIHRAITTVRLAFIEPNAVALHPQDFEDIRLMKNANGDYLYGSPAQAGPTTIWGLPSAVTTNVPNGTGIVGKFNEAILWMREGIALAASDSHADFFIKNLVAILAEARAAFGIPRPAAFCAVTGI